MGQEPLAGFLVLGSALNLITLLSVSLLKSLKAEKFSVDGSPETWPLPTEAGTTPQKTRWLPGMEPTLSCEEE